MTEITQFLSLQFAGQSLGLWLSFFVVVAALLAFDLGVLHKDQHEIGVRESLLLSAGYIAVASLFGAWVWFELGSQAGVDYYTAFFVEKSLSLDNVFVISLIFSAMAIPREYQHRVLFWGIMGVIVLRAVMIGAGAAIVSNFHWVLFIFGAFLVFTGIKMLFTKTEHHGIDPQDSAMLRFLKRHVNVVPRLYGSHFWVKLPSPTDPRKVVWWATPLFAALVMIEFADLVFAVDSVPAVFAITQEPFVVYTSNIFAILGLRALYFALAAMIHRFTYLKYALAAVLIFIGSKIFLVEFFGKIPAPISLGVTFGLLAAGVGVSLWKTRRDGDAAAASPQQPQQQSVRPPSPV
jgi:tellurite resistance protein TerC